MKGNSELLDKGRSPYQKSGNHGTVTMGNVPLEITTLKTTALKLQCWHQEFYLSKTINLNCHPKMNNEASIRGSNFKTETCRIFFYSRITMPQFVRALCMHTFSDSVGLKDEV